MEVWRETVSRQGADLMFGGEGVALVCLRDRHGWNIVGKGNPARYEVEEERGCSRQLLGLEFMPSANGSHSGLWKRWLGLRMLLKIRSGYWAE